MKKLISAIVLLITAHAFSQPVTYLQNTRNLTKSQLSAIISGVTIPNKAWYESQIFNQLGVNYSAAIEARSLTPYDFTTIGIGLDTSRVRLRPYFIPAGTYTVSSPLVITSDLRIDGFSGTRVRDDLSNITGSIITTSASTASDTAGIIESKFQGIRIENIFLKGNSRLNGNGYYAYRTNSPVITTLGGYGIGNSTAYLNGKSGFNIEGSDGNLFYNLETYGNAGYGIKVTDAAGNGKTFAAGSSSEAGTTNIFLSGRSRANTAGGIYNYVTKANIFIGTQSIGDTTVNFKSYNTRGQIQIGPDYEFARPPRSFSGAQPRANNMEYDTDRALTWIGGYVGSIHTHSSSLTADAGTSTTAIKDAAVTRMPNDYYIGFEVTVGAETREVTDYVASRDSLVLASAIVGLTTNSTYSLKRKADVGILAKNMASSVWINTTMPEQADSVWSGWGDYANAIFINPINFDPTTDIKDRTANTTKYLWIDNDNFGSNRDISIIANAEMNIRTTGDTLKLRGGNGVRVTADSNVVDIQPNPHNTSGTRGDVYLWSSITDNLQPEFRLYFDADTTSGVLNRDYIFLRKSTSQPYAMTMGGLDSLNRLVMAMPLEFSGNNNEARFMDILASSSTFPTATLLPNRVRLYARTDSLWAYNDNGLAINLMRGGTAAGDITAVVAGDGLSGGATSGSATVTFNPKLSGQTLAITSDSVHVKSASLDSSHVTNGGITSTDIATGGILNADIANNAVTPSKLSSAANTHTYFFSKLDTCRAADAFGIVKVPSAITITEIAAFTDQGTVTFNIEQRAETTPNTSGTDVLTADLVADNDQQESTSFNDATVPANTWLYYSASAVSGNADEVTVTIRYTVD